MTNMERGMIFSFKLCVSANTALLQEVTETALRSEVRFLRRYSKLPRVHVSIAVESLIGHCSKYREFDPMLTPVSPSNPWVSGDETLWDVERSL